MATQGRWFRFYDGVVDDPKVQRLPPAIFRFWINILCVASRNGGRIPNAVDLTFSLRMSQKQVSDQLKIIEKAELVDEGSDENGEVFFTPHNWSGRQFQSDVSTPRVQRLRERRRNVSETANETHQNRTEQNRSDQKKKVPFRRRTNGRRDSLSPASEPDDASPFAKVALAL